MNTTQQQLAPLPTMHPGTPGNLRGQIDLIVHRMTANAALVSFPGRVNQVWVPTKHARTLRIPQLGGEPVTVDMPAWLMRRVLEQL